MLNGKNILVTGGTGSFGQAFCRYVLTHFKPNRLIVYSRDEFKQSLMQEEEIFQASCMRYFLVDIRDLQRLTKAMAGVDYVIHAAALKQVPAAEYNHNEFWTEKQANRNASIYFGKYYGVDWSIFEKDYPTK